MFPNTTDVFIFYHSSMFLLLVKFVTWLFYNCRALSLIFLLWCVHWQIFSELMIIHSFLKVLLHFFAEMRQCYVLKLVNIWTKSSDKTSSPILKIYILSCFNPGNFLYHVFIVSRIYIATNAFLLKKQRFPGLKKI